MSQSAEKVDTQAIEKLSRRKAATASRVADLDRERGEAKQMLDDLEKNRKAAVFGALDSIKKRYFGRLLGDRGIKVKAPKVSGVVETTLGKITTIPKIVQKNMNEIEIQPILKNYAYVRILYDTMANEYFYEAIEPKLIEEESELLDVLKEILVGNLELLEESGRAQKENYLRRMVDGVLRELGVELHPVSKERIMYFVFRDFIRYGPIDVVMTDVQVEDVSCDGVRVPLYIYHRKYGSIPSNLKFDSAEELDSFVIWLAQRAGTHISVAQPMPDATLPAGSRLPATRGPAAAPPVRADRRSPRARGVRRVPGDRDGQIRGHDVPRGRRAGDGPPPRERPDQPAAGLGRRPGHRPVAGAGEGRDGHDATREGDGRGCRDGPGVERADHELRVHVEPGR